MLITDEMRPHTLRQWVVDPLPDVRHGRKNEKSTVFTFAR